jgi:hypothetical protein
MLPSGSKEAVPLSKKLSEGNTIIVSAPAFATGHLLSSAQYWQTSVLVHDVPAITTTIKD